MQCCNFKILKLSKIEDFKVFHFLSKYSNLGPVASNKLFLGYSLYGSLLICVHFQDVLNLNHSNCRWKYICLFSHSNACLYVLYWLATFCALIRYLFSSYIGMLNEHQLKRLHGSTASNLKKRGSYCNSLFSKI